ncbi:MAG TPA: 6-phosphogluconolactonase [Vicinamibacterales bacterium]|nr:6-phosphogluconolactonase [Vicinamibacterales bacterium]
MNLRIFDTSGDLIQGAARTLLQRIDAGARTIALSGGSTPKPLYELLGRNEELRKKAITWVIVDERYVAVDDPQSNAGMIEKTLRPARLLRFKTELGDPQKTADEFEREWRALQINRLDVVILGMGDDGHTASLFPGTDVLAVEDRIAAAVFVPTLNAWRVTLTKPVLRAAGLRIVLATGENKRPVLQQVRAGAEYPIALVTDGVETWWFVDREAAGVER